MRRIRSLALSGYGHVTPVKNADRILQGLPGNSLGDERDALSLGAANGHCNECIETHRCLSEAPRDGENSVAHLLLQSLECRKLDVLSIEARGEIDDQSCHASTHNESSK